MLSYSVIFKLQREEAVDSHVPAVSRVHQTSPEAKFMQGMRVWAGRHREIGNVLEHLQSAGVFILDQQVK